MMYLYPPFVNRGKDVHSTVAKYEIIDEDMNGAQTLSTGQLAHMYCVFTHFLK